MTAVALIPARSGSTRVPGKNVRELHGHPLISYTIASALESGAFDRVVVSTDSPEIADIARHYGADAPFLRPESISQSASTDIEWMTHALDQLDGAGYRPNVASLLRPTSPLRQPQSIAKAMALFLSVEGYDSLRAVSKCAQHPAKMWTLSDDGSQLLPLMDLPSTDDVPAHSRPYETLPPVYIQDASLEIMWTTTIRRGSIAGTRILPWLTPYPEGLDVNYPSDWTVLEDVLNQRPDALPRVSQAPYRDSRSS